VERLHAYGLSALLLGVLLSPLRLDPQDPAQDSFPLSTYPMFSYDRGRIASVTIALALGPRGYEAAIPPSFVATSETMQALKTIAKSVREGGARAQELCAAIAERVAHSPDPQFRAADEVAFVRNTVDAIDYLTGANTTRSRHIHVRCPVRRNASSSTP
jgi:hypothetical protein